jgi:hypothetical protein
MSSRSLLLGAAKPLGAVNLDADLTRSLGATIFLSLLSFSILWVYGMLFVLLSDCHTPTSFLAARPFLVPPRAAKSHSDVFSACITPDTTYSLLHGRYCTDGESNPSLAVIESDVYLAEHLTAYISTTNRFAHTIATHH